MIGLKRYDRPAEIRCAVATQISLDKFRWFDDAIGGLIELFRRLKVNFLHLVQKKIRHQDTKTQRKLLSKGFPLCLGTFVAIFSRPQADPG